MPICKQCNEFKHKLCAQKSMCKSCKNENLRLKRLQLILDRDMNGGLGLERRVCTDCKIEKDELEFYPYIKSRCKKCVVQCSRDAIVKRYPKELLRGAKKRALDKGLPCTLVEEDIVIPEFCPVLGMPLIIATESGTRQLPNSPSLDRIDNSKGYTPDNVMVISWRANALKNNSTPDELRRILAYVEGRLVF